MGDGLHPGFSLVIDVFKLDCFVKIYHALSIILLLISYPLVDGVTWNLLSANHLVINVLALNYIGDLGHEFLILFP